MESLNQEDVLHTFAARADGYDAESSWVRKEDLIDPLLAECGSGPFLSLIDVCGGTGAVAARAAALNWRSAVVDLSQEMLLRRCPRSLSALRGDAHHIPLASGSVDRAALRQGLQYVEPRTVLLEMARVGRQIAVAQIVAPTEEDRSVWEDYFAISSPGRRRVFVAGAIVALFAEAGLCVLRVERRHCEALLGDSIRHLRSQERDAALESFSRSTPEFRRRSGLHDKVDENARYVQNWEFVVGESEARFF